MILAFDVGGTRIKAGAMRGGKPVASAIADTPSGAGETIAELVRIGSELLDGSPCDGVGLCVPGLVDERGVVVALSGKLEDLVGEDLPAALAGAFGARAVVTNDAMAYATGEAARGAGAGFERVAVVTIGTGVGVCVVHRGAPLTPGTLGGGILGGFIPISERTDGAADSSGRPDTIEALCAARRIVDAARAEGFGGSSVEEVYDACARGDGAARRGVASYREHLVRALVALAHAHTPGCIVLGGGPMTPGNPVVEGLQDAVRPRLYAGYEVAVRVATLGDSAALVGLGELVGG